MVDHAQSFGAVAEQYDRNRPSYPDELIDSLVADGAVDVLDVGCGTGIASRLFAARGCRVLGVDPDERMAAIARAHGIEVEIGLFETWDDRGRRFDLIVSCTAWHWVNGRIGVPKALGLLRPGGTFAMIWNSRRHPPEVMAAFEVIYAPTAPHLLNGSVALGTDSRIKSGVPNAEHRVDEWDRGYTTESWIAEVTTHSGHLVLEPDVLADIVGRTRVAIDGLGGRFTSRYTTDAFLLTAD